MSQNMDQKRASFALECVNEIDDPNKADVLKTQSARFIALIVNSGFLQAMDFFSNNLKTQRTFRYLEKWFAEGDDDGPRLATSIRDAAANRRRSLNQELASLDDTFEYRRAMGEAVAFLGWLKSKAEGRKFQIKADLDQPADQREE